MTDLLSDLRRDLEQTPQDPIWHGEGSVWNHTQAVCAALEVLPEFQEARTLLQLAAQYHDIGKIHATRMENGRWCAPGHARISAELARGRMWRALSGTAEKQQLREAVCLLIRYHSLPLHAVDEPDGALRLQQFAANGILAPGATVRNLCALATADVLGRECPDRAELLEKIELCRELARESGCYDGPYSFPTDHTRFAYLSGRKVPPEYPLYDDTWGPVILMSGLPGTGKDTWIRETCPDLPMVSLDDIRKELGIPPTGDQARVIDTARARAKGYLRRREPFVWNATNLTAQLRAKQLRLFADYGAAVRLVYLETSWPEQCSRNKNRPDAVPEAALERMLEMLTPPECREAPRVEWHCV